MLALYGPDVLLGGHPVEWLAQWSWDFTLGGVGEWEVIWESLWEESAMLMRICGGVLRGTLLKIGPADFLRGLKWNRHTSFILLTCLPAWVSIFLLEMFLNCPAGVHGVPQAYLHEIGWFIQDFRTAGHGGWLPEPVSFQLVFSGPTARFKKETHTSVSARLFLNLIGACFSKMSPSVNSSSLAVLSGFCALFSFPTLPHRVWFALAQLSVGAVVSGFYFLEDCAVYWNVSLCKSLPIGQTP